MYRCTIATLDATAVAAIVSFPERKEFDLSSLRACFSIGEPVPREIALRWEEMTGHRPVAIDHGPDE
jgi:acyl-coenzyme A synthetase/AMP-(fatty) acid ligase